MLKPKSLSSLAGAENLAEHMHTTFSCVKQQTEIARSLWGRQVGAAIHGRLGPRKAHTEGLQVGANSRVSWENREPLQERAWALTLQVCASHHS